MNLMRRRRALMGSKKESGRIPSAYQEVEWVGVTTPANTNSALISLNYTPTISPRVEASIKMGTSAVAYFWGNKIALYQQNSNTYANFGETSASYVAKGVFGQYWSTVDAGKIVYVNGTSRKTFADYDWSQNTENFALFRGGTSTFTAMFQYAKLYDGTSLVRDLVPCYRKSNGRPGFYCLISKTFYTNAGAATILQKGPDVT